MYQALLYLQLKSAENLIRSRISRLKQPKYAIGLIIGIAWLYLVVVRRSSSSTALNGLNFPIDQLREMIVRMGAIVILARAVFAWAIPDSKSGIIFSVAEIAFLFPAPISRKGLLRYKLITSQLKLFVSSVFLVFVTNRFSSFGGNVFTHAIGYWLFLGIMTLHGTGASLTISRLIENGVSAARRRAFVFGTVGGAFALSIISAIRSAAGVPTGSGPIAFYGYIAQVLDSGILHWLIAPFKLAVAPIVAPDWSSFASAIGPGLALLALHLYWVLRMETSFEEAAIASSERVAAKIASMRAGTYRIGSGPRISRKPAFKLRDSGRPEIAFLWKNLLSAPSYLNPRVFLSLAVIIDAGVGWIGNQPEYARTVLPMFLFLPAIFGFYVFVAGPQFARQDMRSDLANTDLLRTYPLPGWQIILGELLTPTAILTGILWLLLLMATIAARHTHSIPLLTTPAAITTAAVAVALLIPILCAMQMLVANAAAVLFPGWQSVGNARSAGMEVVGQRLILSFGRLLFVVLAILPPLLIGFIMAGTGYFFGVVPAAILVAGTSVGILTLEFSLGLWWVGRRFEKLDLSSELRL